MSMYERCAHIRKMWAYTETGHIRKMCAYTKDVGIYRNWAYTKDVGIYRNWAYTEDVRVFCICTVSVYAQFQDMEFVHIFVIAFASYMRKFHTHKLRIYRNCAYKEDVRIYGNWAYTEDFRIYGNWAYTEDMPKSSVYAQFPYMRNFLY